MFILLLLICCGAGPLIFTGVIFVCLLPFTILAAILDLLEAKFLIPKQTINVKSKE